MPKLKMSLDRRPSPDMRRGLLPISAVMAGELDRLADINLQLGYHTRAEFLAHQAAELRAMTDLNEGRA